LGCLSLNFECYRIGVELQKDPLGEVEILVQRKVLI
jgi:hypothetical protein